jgi:hypothetical protein
MRVFIIDTSNMGPELQGGLIGVVGSVSVFPTAAEKKECVETVARYAADGWAIAADPRTLIGRLAALTAETACVPFLNVEKLDSSHNLPVSGPTDNRLIGAGGVRNGIDRTI